MIDEKVSRKEFFSDCFVKGAKIITAASAISLLTRCDEKHKSDSYKFVEFNSVLYESILKILQEQAHYNYWDVRKEQIDNLRYAIDKICPENHDEMTFAVACSIPFSPMNYVVDEYTRRKNGKNPSGPDHPILELKKWGVPNTMKIIVFKEQLKSLMREVIDYDKCDHSPISFSWSIKTNKLTINEFYEMINEKYKIELDKTEVKTIYCAISYFYHSGVIPYAWCSSMVNRAFGLMENKYGPVNS
ncbi:hypothetical protein ACFL20_06615 [Spirochaetota bacterium]